MLISDVLRQKGSAVKRVLSNEKVVVAVRKLAEYRIGVLVVENDAGRMVGIFSERDFVNAVARHGDAALSRPVSDLMTSPVATCLPTDRIEDMLAKMTANRYRHLPVVQGGQLMGMVSIGDLVKNRLDEKELETNVLLDLQRMRA